MPRPFPLNRECVCKLTPLIQFRIPISIQIQSQTQWLSHTGRSTSDMRDTTWGHGIESMQVETQLQRYDVPLIYGYFPLNWTADHRCFVSELKGRRDSRMEIS